MPYESIEAKEYEKMVSQINKLNIGRVRGEEVVIERFCDNDVCEVDFTTKESLTP